MKQNIKNQYVTYHLHSDLSLLDSCTKFQDYIDKAVELGQTAICFTEHGNIYNWVKKKYACDKAGIKYLHGCEIYLTEQLDPKVRDNYHTILIAKNMDGLREMNKLISISNSPDHFYFKPRITFEEFLNISNNVIKISACLASPLNKLDIINPSYERLLSKYDYYEIQPHINSEEQKRYNKKLFEYSKKYNKPLIAGTDTHSLNQYKAECRSMLQLAKGIEFTNEDEFDLTYKSYEELVNMFDKQGALPRTVYLEAIENTNKMANSTEAIVLDESFKYPKIYDDDIAEIKKRLNIMLQDKIDKGIIPKEQRKEFITHIREEVAVFEKINMCGFMLFMSDLIQWCHKNNIPTGPARGSCGGSCVAYVLDIIDLNPIQWKTVFSRFANENRKEIGDIDVDFAPDDREAVYNHMIEEFGEEYTDYILAIGTISDKGTIDEIGRALSRKFPDNKDFSLESIKKVKNEYDKNPEKAKEDYPDIFYYFDGMLNTAISQSMHPCGMVVSPITLADNYGEFYRDGKKIIQIDMDAIHDVSLVKYDLLGLKNVGIIKDTCNSAGIDYPKTYKIDWNDQAVWDDMLKTPAGLFQFEGAYAYQMLCKFEPKSIFDMSLVTAALRPSGATYRDELIKKHFHNNPSPIIDEMLKDNYGYLCLEENQRICTPNGFTCIKDIKEGDVVYTSKKPSKVTNKYNNGIQKIYKVKTKCGIIACTKNHKLLTQEGYIPLEKIMQDVDRYCIGHKINEYGSVIHDSNKMKILGWLLGDGCTTQTRGKSINKVMFTHATFEDCLDFKKAIENAFPDLTVSIKNIKSRVNKTDLYRCNVLGIRRTNGRCGLNSLCSYLKDMNMYDKDALHKTIPNELYSAHKISLLYFIGAYTDTDSCIKKQPNAIQYKTVSKELALGIQEILRHLGFIATIYENKNKEHVSYAIVVNSACNFLRTIYPYSNKVRRLFENIEDIKNKRNLDTGEFPVKYIQKVLDKNSISLKKVQTKLNNTLYDKKYITEGTVKKISKFFNIKIDAFDENIKYYRILSIEEDSISQVYDISVADVHDFVLEGGIVTHNCYQEDIIKFLQEVCGLSGSDADNVRRGIARKKPEVLEEAMPAIMEGYCNKSEHSREEAEKEAREFLQIIEDASSYMFGYNHSVAYCLIGYLCAYLRHYHPADFITSYLNNADNEDDIVAGYELAKVYKVNIYPPRFRYSIDKYVLDKDTGNIYKGISSIKFLNSGAATFLYSLRNNEYKDFVDVLVDISQSNEVNTRQLEILIRLQFFQEFGNNGKLLKIYNMFKAVYGRKQLNKSKLDDTQINMDMLSKYVKVETDKMLKDIDTIGFLKEYSDTLENANIPLQEQIKFEFEMLGYINTIYDNIEKNICYVLDIDTKYSPKLTLYSLGTGKEITVKVQKSVYENNIIKKSSIIHINKFEQKYKSIRTENGWEKTSEKEWWIKSYKILNDFSI